MRYFPYFSSANFSSLLDGNNNWNGLNQWFGFTNFLGEVQFQGSIDTPFSNGAILFQSGPNMSGNVQLIGVDPNGAGVGILANVDIDNSILPVGPLQVGIYYVLPNVSNIVGTIVPNPGDQYNAGGFSHELRIYAYKDINSVRYYSNPVTSDVVTDANDSNDYHIDWTWDNPPDGSVDGFLLLKQDTLHGWVFGDVGYVAGFLGGNFQEALQGNPPDFPDATTHAPINKYPALAVMSDSDVERVGIHCIPTVYSKLEVAGRVTVRDETAAPVYGFNADDMLVVVGTGDSTGMWRGRMTAGGDNVKFLMGEYNSQGWLGAHSGALNAWANFYINPDGGATCYIGNTNGDPLIVADNTAGCVGIRNPSPQAYLDVDLSDGSIASFRIQTGSLVSVLLPGAIENGANLFFTLANGTVRHALGGSIFDYHGDVGNSGTTETDLYASEIPSATLIENSQKLYAHYAGIFVNSTSTKRLKVYFGGSAIFDSGALTVSAATSWDIEVNIIRVGSDNVRCSVKMNDTGAATLSLAKYTELSGVDLDATGQEFKITGTAAGTGAATDDIVAKFGHIEFKGCAA